MKRTVITVALFAVLATMAESCQKEKIVGLQPTYSEMTTIRTISYTVDGVTDQIILRSEAEWDGFVDGMLSLAAQGHEVSFVNYGATVNGEQTKDVQTLTTPDPTEAKTWAKEKIDEGYQVSTTYANGQYTVVAIK